MRRLAIGLVVAAVLAGCSGSSTDDGSATETPQTAAQATTTAEPATTISERMAHWQDVVKSMKCPELADLEQKRMAVQFNDQTESLIAIHDRQAELHCPQ